MTQTIKALLFDLGGVVLDISFEKALERWSHHSGVSPDALRARFTPYDAYEQHERGEIEAEAYYASLRTAFGVTLTDEQLEDGWNAIFLGEIPKTVALLERLKGKIPLYAFSNTNAVHKLFWSQRYSSALAPFERVFVSSDMGKRKPERAAFEYVAKEMGVGLENILFFDDTEANVSAARALGMQAVLVVSPGDVATAVEPFL
ncbi:HAD family phosphatase [soil metagenome]